MLQIQNHDAFKTLPCLIMPTHKIQFKKQQKQEQKNINDSIVI